MGRDFILSSPECRESHYIAICRALTRVFRGEITNLIINVPPRYGKTTILTYFVAWAMARYPESNFLYISYSHSLAQKQTSSIRDIMSMSEYKNLFYVNLSKTTKAKSDFETTFGGSVYAAGISGTITGHGAGIKGGVHFGGAIIIDDAHKPDEAHSDTVRDGVVESYKNTIQSRRNNGRLTPIIYIGQRVHEADLAAYMQIKDSETWEILSLPALDAVNNALHPELHSKEILLDMKEHDPYNFASQYQQNPQPAGGGIFKKEWFVLLEQEPELLMTFITADTAETDKTYNDATVFSFWGVYEIKHGDTKTGKYGLHWLDSWEIWVEPKDLEPQFKQFYLECMRHPVKPSVIGIEKKSTGVTLASVLKEMQGLQVLPINRTKASGSKISRFLEMQKYVASRQVSFTREAKHTKLCIEHCAKIAANDTHMRDDICDTFYDAINLVLIDGALVKMYVNSQKAASHNIVETTLRSQHSLQKIRSERQW